MCPFRHCLLNSSEPWSYFWKNSTQLWKVLFVQYASILHWVSMFYIQSIALQWFPALGLKAPKRVTRKVTTWPIREVIFIYFEGIPLIFVVASSLDAVVEVKRFVVLRGFKADGVGTVCWANGCHINATCHQFYELIYTLGCTSSFFFIFFVLYFIIKCSSVSVTVVWMKLINKLYIDFMEEWSHWFNAIPVDA